MFSPAIKVSLFQSQLVDSEKGYKPLFKALNTVAEESIYEIMKFEAKLPWLAPNQF